MALSFGKRENESQPTPVRPLGAAPAASPVQPLGAHAASQAAQAAADNGARLTVGANIKLKGVEITDCDTLAVEGTVEATINARVIQIADKGAFKGTAEIDTAEIRGLFEGTLTVRQKIIIYPTGKVTGKVRYGKIVIEEGGQLSGEITADAQAGKS
nr:polymer-forming cytoskeletal protein [uncultured Ottowia sp.]